MRLKLYNRRKMVFQKVSHFLQNEWHRSLPEQKASFFLSIVSENAISRNFFIRKIATISFLICTQYCSNQQPATQVAIFDHFPKQNACFISVTNIKLVTTQWLNLRTIGRIEHSVGFLEMETFNLQNVFSDWFWNVKGDKTRFCRHTHNEILQHCAIVLFQV